MKNKLFALAVAGLGLVTLASCGGKEDPTKTPAPNPQPQPTETQTETPEPTPTPETVKVVSTFTGKIKIKDSTEELDGVLKTYEDGTFVFDTSVKNRNVKGTYVLDTNTGYLLTLDDADKTQIQSTWDAEAKAHVLTFDDIKLGGKGNGSAVLKCVDEDYEFLELTAAQKLVRRAKFEGGWKYMVEHDGKQMPNLANIDMTFTADGKAIITSDLNKEDVEKEATYTFANNVFTVNYNGKEFKSSYDVVKNIYTLPFEVVIGGETKKFDMTFNAMVTTVTGYVERFNGLTVNLYVYSDGTAFFDCICTTPVAEIQQLQFDTPAKYTVQDNTYTFTIEKRDREGKITTINYTGTVDEKGVFTMDYALSPELLFKLEGKLNDTAVFKDSVVGKGNMVCNFTAALGAENAANLEVDIQFLQGFLNSKGTYKKISDSEIELTFNLPVGSHLGNPTPAPAPATLANGAPQELPRADLKVKAKFDEAKGAFVAETFSVKGEMEIALNLVLNIW